MESIIGDLGQFISDHRAWAGPIVGAIAFGESLAIIGMFIPATPIMIAIGGFVGAGIVEPLPVIIGAVIGAVAGDIISYLLGWWLGRNIIHKWPLNKYRSAVARARLLFRRYGFTAFFFGPVLRAGALYRADGGWHDVHGPDPIPDGKRAFGTRMGPAHVPSGLAGRARGRDIRQNGWRSYALVYHRYRHCHCHRNGYWRALFQGAPAPRAQARGAGIAGGVISHLSCGFASA